MFHYFLSLTFIIHTIKWPFLLLPKCQSKTTATQFSWKQVYFCMTKTSTSARVTWKITTHITVCSSFFLAVGLLDKQPAAGLTRLIVSCSFPRNTPTSSAVRSAAAPHGQSGVVSDCHFQKWHTLLAVNDQCHLYVEWGIVNMQSCWLSEQEFRIKSLLDQLTLYLTLPLPYLSVHKQYFSSLLLRPGSVGFICKRFHHIHSFQLSSHPQGHFA